MEERNRITREIHDTIGYSLTNVAMMLEAAQDLAKNGPQRLLEKLRAARLQIQQGLENTRRALYLLRDKEETEPIGLPAIQRMVSVFGRASGIQVDVEYGDLPLSSGNEMDGVMFHFIQESLTNAFRHGRASLIQVRFWRQNGEYRIVVRDNGVGAENISEGIGMTGMRERLGKLGGTLTVQNAADGFEIRALIPIADSSERT